MMKLMMMRLPIFGFEPLVNQLNLTNGSKPKIRAYSKPPIERISDLKKKQ
jgi:hypothetical protein